jgi:hypothetical protein
MASPLAATLRSTDKKKNRTVPGDTIALAFSQLPRAADDVEISIQQGQFQENGDIIPGAVLASFRGRVRDGKYVPASATAFRRKSVEDMRLKATDGTNTIEIGLLDAGSAVTSNELHVTVRGTVAGKNEFFQGKSAMFVYYPLAMIVPTRTAKADKALNIISHWATAQWQRKDKNVRRVHQVQTIAPPRSVTPASYDALIAAFAKAVKDAPGGIIALAIGHGDGGTGQGNSNPWCDLMPEDIKKIVDADGSERFPHTLFIDKPILLDGSRKGSFPTGRNAVILNALDRIADELAKASLPVRKLILHTCNVGNDRSIPADPRRGEAEIGGFTQLFADRVRVPVQAHTDFVAYTGELDRDTILAHYESDQPTQNSAHEWPLTRVSPESLPGAAPRRHPL